jgi:serine/threonine-protein kinase
MALGRAKAVKVVGRYELAHELAQSYLGPLHGVYADGGEGGTQAGMLRLVALATLDADARVRLLEAAWQAMEVRDEHVASVIDVVASDGELGVVMEYVEGQTLRSLVGLAGVRRKPMPVAVALRVVKDVLAGVAALHRASADFGEEAVPLYGGLSADSVLVGTDGRAYVLDVAIASVAASVEALGRQADRVAYAAPEQLASPPHADARTDVFTMGVLAWELLSNRRLFMGSDKAVAQKVLAAKIPRLDEVKRLGDSDIPAAALSAVMKALERDPAARFSSIDEMAEALAATEGATGPETAVAEYVASVAEGPLAKTRDAFRDPTKGTRSAIGSRVLAKASAPNRAAPRGEAKAEPKKELPRAIVKPGGAAPLKIGSPVAKAAKPSATANVLPAPKVQPAKPATRRATMLGVAPAPSPVAPARSAQEAKPAPAARTEGAFPFARPLVEAAVAAPPSPHAGPRPRQPTMIGIPLPASPSSHEILDRPTIEQTHAAASAPPAVEAKAPAEPPATEPAADAAATLGDRFPDELVESVPPGVHAPEAPPRTRDLLPSFGDEEPTAQYSARELLSQVEALARPSEPSKAPDDFPEPPTRPRVDADGDPDAVVPSGEWLDEPEEAPRGAALATAPAPAPLASVSETAPGREEPVPRAMEPGPSNEAARARERPSPTPGPLEAAPAIANVERPMLARAMPAAPIAPPPASIAPPPASIAPPAFLPSQIPPPLIHDPRANRTPTTPPPKARATVARSGSGVLLGAALSLAIVAVTAGIGVVALRMRSAGDPAAAPTSAPRVESVGAAATVAPPSTPEAPAAAPAAAASNPAPPAAASAPERAPELPGTAPAAPPTPEPPQAAAPAPAAVAPALPKVAPAPRAAAPAKRRSGGRSSKSRYVPDDI